jgi:hypothetical protein
MFGGVWSGRKIQGCNWGGMIWGGGDLPQILLTSKIHPASATEAMDATTGSAAGSATLTLYNLPEAWGLPSLSPACVQAEAYLRWATVPSSICIETCSSASKSPSGQVPAIERGADVSEASVSEFTAAQAVISFCKKNSLDLDANLSGAQRAELLAFSTLVTTKLNLATTLCTWCEDSGFKAFKQVESTMRLCPAHSLYLAPHTGSIWELVAVSTKLRHTCYGPT